MFFFHFRDLFINDDKCSEKDDSHAAYRSAGLKSWSGEYEFSRVVSCRGIESDESILIELGQDYSLPLPVSSLLFRALTALLTIFVCLDVGYFPTE